MGTLTKAEDLEKMRRRIESITPDSQRQWGKMTVNQVLTHLTDQFRMALGELETEDVSNFFSRNFLKHLVLTGIPIPKGKVPTLPELDHAQSGGTPPTDFASDKATLLTYLDRVSSQPADGDWGFHGKFGQMSRKQWLKMGYDHLDHHLNQFGV